MKNEKTYKPPSMDAISWRIVAAVLAFWLVCMILLTWGVAMDLYGQLEIAAQRNASMWADWHYKSADDNTDAPGYADYCRLNAISRLGGMIWIYPRLFPQSTVDQMLGIGSGDPMPVGFAMSYTYRDGDRLVRLSTAGEYDWCGYFTEDQWASDTQPEQVAGYLYIDCSEQYATSGEVCRLTGWFEGARFYPVMVERATAVPDEWSRRDRIHWNTVYECAAPAQQEIVTVYCRNEVQVPRSGGDYLMSNVLNVTIDGTQYTTLSDVLPTVAERNSLIDAVVRGYGDYEDRDGNMVHARIVLRARPLAYAMERLLWVYVISFAVAAVTVWLFLRMVRRNLIAPTARVAACMADGMKPLPEENALRWREGFELERGYDGAASAYHDARTKVIQLQTALDYAQNAEAHRRKMISGITHELKTPLAVIHSYAEGLREGIAAEKQEQYLDVILEETERMDAMVLQMLDLSRLEAGKVRLSADRFSLLELTRGVFDRLTPMAQERKLQIHYTMTEDFLITADESRIRQAVTNFATNAIKYTPEGGNIRLQIYDHGGKAHFILTNECEPLPEGALEQVWDSFYRIEESRTSRGTGLGLSIARAVIELHGGSVQAQNTAEGVEFRFILP